MKPLHTTIKAAGSVPDEVWRTVPFPARHSKNVQRRALNKFTDKSASFFLGWPGSTDSLQRLHRAVTTLRCWLCARSDRKSIWHEQKSAAACLIKKPHDYCMASFFPCRVIYATNLTANRCYTRTTNHSWFLTGDGSKGRTSRRSPHSLYHIWTPARPDWAAMM